LDGQLLWQSLVLGLVQGLTEFLPVSSTAHLILVPALLQWALDARFQFAFDVLIQWGTLIAVIVYFWRDLWAIVRAVVVGLWTRQPLGTLEARLGWLTVAATLPAVAAGLALKDFVESLHAQPLVIAGVLIAFSLMIFAVERIGRRQRTLDSLTWRDALLIGAAQAVALIPGVSRSGATICGALLIGLERRAAARFSFIVSIPALLGAGVLALRDAAEHPEFATFLPVLALGMLVAGVVGFFTIHWLLGFIARRSMDVFAWYRIAAGALMLAVLWGRGG
jgi:undecaprenyl-diphosphatase